MPTTAWIERSELLERLAAPVRDRWQSLVPPGPVKDALSGTWLGHVLHPVLTDLPIGFWTSACTVDVVATLTGDQRARELARTLVGLGVATAVPTAITGASDWADTRGPASRVGIAHALANTVALGCFTASWATRRRGRHGRGVAWGALGATAATVGGWLGGHMIGRLGVGVDQSLAPRPPAEWTVVANRAQVGDGPLRARAGDAPVLLLRPVADGDIVCLGAICPHRGAPMEDGELADGILTCPWHGSRFRAADGGLERGPSVAPLPHHDCRVVDDLVAVRDRAVLD